MDSKLVTDAWLKALVSGSYTQTKGALYCNTKRSGSSNFKGGLPGHCCLGVLGDILVKMYPERFSWLDAEDGIGFMKLLDSEEEVMAPVTAMLPQSLWRDMGLPFDQGVLISLNDTKNESFAAIAAYIEERQYADKALPGKSSEESDEGLEQVAASA